MDHLLIATLMRETGETGVQTHFNEFRNYLDERGIKSTLVTPFSYLSFLSFVIMGVRKVIDVLHGEASVWWYRYWHYFFLKSALKKKLNKVQTSAVYAQCPLSAKAAISVRRGLELKIFMIVHFNVSQAEEWAQKGKIKKGGALYNSIRNMEEKVFTQLDGIIYVSNYMKETLERIVPNIKHKNSIVIPNFIHRTAANTPLESKRDLLNIGTLEPRKNQSYLLQVLYELKLLGKKCNLTLIGDGQDRKKLEKLAETLTISDRVLFLGYQNNASRYFAKHRIYCHCSKMENHSVTLIEALSNGIPILAAPVGGIPEIFSHGIEGFYWPLDDPRKGAYLLIKLLENDDLYTSISKSAYERFSKNYEASAIASRLLRFLSV